MASVILLGIWEPMNYYNIGQWFPNGSERKESTCSAGDLSVIPGLGRSPGGRNGNSLQYSCLENPMYISTPTLYCLSHQGSKLNKQDDNIQPWHTPFPIWNQSVLPCPVLTVASSPAYKFLKRQVRWSGIPRISHSLL